MFTLLKQGTNTGKNASNNILNTLQENCVFIDN